MPARLSQVDKKLLLSEVAERVNQQFADELHCLFNDDNADKLILRIRVLGEDGAGGKEAGGGDDDAMQDDVFLKKIESSMLSAVKLQGVEGIRKVFLRESKRTRLDPRTQSFVTDTEWVLDTEGGVGWVCGWVETRQPCDVWRLSQSRGRGCYCTPLLASYLLSFMFIYAVYMRLLCCAVLCSAVLCCALLCYGLCERGEA
jgi:hypothetical protein